MTPMRTECNMPTPAGALCVIPSRLAIGEEFSVKTAWSSPLWGRQM
jgi:hypothetical protein